jgi:hypothetical protein
MIGILSRTRLYFIGFLIAVVSTLALASPAKADPFCSSYYFQIHLFEEYAGDRGYGSNDYGDCNPGTVETINVSEDASVKGSFWLRLGFYPTDSSPYVPECEYRVIVNGVLWISGDVPWLESEEDDSSYWEANHEPPISNLLNAKLTKLTAGKSLNTANVVRDCTGYPLFTQSVNFKVLPASNGEFNGMTINESSKYTNSRQVNLHLSFEQLPLQVMVSNDPRFPKSNRKTYTYSKNPISWNLDSLQNEQKTVYVRYKFNREDEWAFGWSETYSDQITLDTVAPNVELLSVGLHSSTKLKSVKTEISASDNKSGLNKIQYSVSKNKSKAVTLNNSKSFKVNLDSDISTIYVRVSDGAGNWSKWKPSFIAAANLATNKKYAAKPLGEKVGVPIVSSKAKVSFKIAKSSKKICKKSGSRIKALKAGKCVVTFTVKEPKTKKGKQPKPIKVTKTFMVR